MLKGLVIRASSEQEVEEGRYLGRIECEMRFGCSFNATDTNRVIVSSGKAGYGERLLHLVSPKL